MPQRIVHSFSPQYVYDSPTSQDKRALKIWISAKKRQHSSMLVLNFSIKFQVDFIFLLSRNNDGGADDFNKHDDEQVSNNICCCCLSMLCFCHLLSSQLCLPLLASEHNKFEDLSWTVASSCCCCRQLYYYNKRVCVEHLFIIVFLVVTSLTQFGCIDNEMCGELTDSKV